MNKVLLVEKDYEMREMIASLLLDHFGNEISITESASGTEGLKILEQASANLPFSLLVMDCTLAELSGTDFLKQVREKHSSDVLTILVITKENEPEVHLSLLQMGANDYLVKPFDRTTLLMRVKSLIRKNPAEPQPGKMTLGKITIDTRSFDVYCGSERVHLTPSEFKLLLALIERRGVILTREKLIELVQGQGIAVVDRAVDTHIFGLRKKLGDAGDEIETIRGVGYRAK